MKKRKEKKKSFLKDFGILIFRCQNTFEMMTVGDEMKKRN
jgi:hypothetical protein